ncbi:MAG: hypothetical protein AAFT19_07950 [Pseudomonadota bacterium]
MAEVQNAHGIEHVPAFIPGPDGSDWLFTFTVVLAIASVVGVGTLYLTLHSLPEKLAHRESSTQFQLVGILGLLALFTHNNLFWVAALVLATIRLPDIGGPLERIAASLEKDPPAPDPADEQVATAAPVTALPEPTAQPAPQPALAVDAMHDGRP